MITHFIDKYICMTYHQACVWRTTATSVLANHFWTIILFLNLWQFSQSWIYQKYYKIRYLFVTHLPITLRYFCLSCIGPSIHPSICSHLTQEIPQVLRWQAYSAKASDLHQFLDSQFLKWLECWLARSGVGVTKPIFTIWIFIPPEQRSCWGVYWFQSVRLSVRPSVRLSRCRVRSVTSTVLDGFFPY